LILYSYSTEHGIGKGPAYSLSGRPDARSESAAPGPGAYSPDLPSKSGGFSMAGRTEQKLDSSAPGPGAYDHGSHVGKAPAFSMSGRPEARLESEAPGPGAYTQGEHIGKGPAFSMSGRNFFNIIIFILNVLTVFFSHESLLFF
jgi:hypothetical protein